jgi:DNA repair protein SbcC/Rad50
VKPLRLKVEAFGPFLEPQTIDFTAFADIGLFLIHGPTGSGKSTVLDAITYALFDPRRDVERSGGDFVTTLDPGAETRVEFEFEHGGRRYRIVRTPAQQRRSRRGDGMATVPAEAELHDLTANKVLASRAGEVTRLVEELLNVNAEQFRQTILLPQGEFRKVITEHDKRREVLARVFHTERFARFTDRVKRKAADLATEARHVQEQRQQRLERAGVANRGELAERLTEAAGRRDEAREQRDRKDQARTRANAALDAGRQLAERFAELASRRDALARLEAQADEMDEARRRLDAGRRASRALDRRTTFERATKDLQDAQRQLQEARERAEEATEMLQAKQEALEREEARGEERDVAESQLRQLEALAGPLEEFRGAEEQLATKTRAVGETETAVQEVRERLEELEKERAALRSERDEPRDRRRGGSRAQGAAAGARERGQGARADRAAARDDRRAAVGARGARRGRVGLPAPPRVAAGRRGGPVGGRPRRGRAVPRVREHPPPRPASCGRRRDGHAGAR